MQKDIIRWKEYDKLDSCLKEELNNMNDEQLNDAFYKNIEFGTAGMRGVLGAGTNRINIYTIRKATKGFAKYIKKHNGEDRGVAIAFDNRHMSKELANDSARLLSSLGIKTYLFESLRPTPELSFAVRELNCFGGIMITASHNPKEYNGYKLYDEKGCQLIPSLADEVISFVNEIEDELSIEINETEESKKLINIIGEDIDQKYLDKVSSICLNDDKVDKSLVKIVFSPEHGTANIPVQKLFNKHGYNYILVESQSAPDPDFSNTKTPNPESPLAYEKAIEIAKKNNADIILVCDPDADRMGVGVKTDEGYELLTGNQSGAILIEYILSQKQEKGLLRNNSVMFNTVVTSDLGEKIANSYGVECEKTLTGFKFIGEKIAKYELKQEKDYVFGYEESYGSLISPFVRDKDAMQACLMLAEASCYYAQKGKTLLDVLNDLYVKHGFYKESQVSLSLEGEKGSIIINKIMDQLRYNPLNYIGEEKVLKLEDFKNLEIIDIQKNTKNKLTGFYQSNVLKYFLEDGSFVAIRPSGTEPKCKFYYCIKGKDKKECETKTAVMQEYMKRIYEKIR